MTEPDAPRPRGRTIREAVAQALREESLTLRELSERVGIPERDVPDHLSHVERSAKAHGERLRVEPAHCLDCGFLFEKRKRYTKPGHCPSCRGTHVAPPRFSLG